jgi:hypothetical protein
LPRIVVRHAQIERESAQRGFEVNVAPARTVVVLIRPVPGRMFPRA